MALRGAIDPALGNSQQPTHEPAVYQTLRAVVNPSGPLRPAMQKMQALAPCREPHAPHVPSSNQGPPSLDGSFARFQMDVQGIDRESDSGTVVESETARRRGRGTVQYESIVEYRCCWSGTYRPRAYANKTGQKRQRAPSTKVSHHVGIWCPVLTVFSRWDVKPGL